MRPAEWRWHRDVVPWCFFGFVSSSSPAGGSPVRIAARRPGSRLAAWSGNGLGRSPASRALLGERLSGPQHQATPAASLSGLPLGGSEEVPSRGHHDEGHGRGVDPGLQLLWTSRRRGRGTFRRWRRELGRPSPARWCCGCSPEKGRFITGDEPGSGRFAGWASEAAVVPLERAGQQNPA